MLYACMFIRVVKKGRVVSPLLVCDGGCGHRCGWCIGVRVVSRVGLCNVGCIAFGVVKDKSLSDIIYWSLFHNILVDRVMGMWTP